MLAATLDVPADGEVEGTLVAHGSHSGGYAVYLQDRRLHFAYNFVGTEITVVSAERRAARRSGRGEGRRHQGGDGRYDVALSYGDVPVGEGTIPRRTPITYGMTGFAVGYQPGGPICPALDGRAEVTPGVLRTVVIEPEGRPQRDPGPGAPQGPRHPVTPNCFCVRSAPPCGARAHRSSWGVGVG